MQRISITNPQNIIDGTAKKYYFKLRNTGGPKGDKGDKGDTGSRGPQGEPGNAATVYVGSTTTLPVGQDATVENVGTQYNAVLNFGIPQGPRGPQGVKGDPGEPGQKGEPGPRGVQGERGTNATVYIGTTTTLNPGSQATVYNSGSDSNAVLNFGIPKGEKGDTGSQGPQGPTGQNFAPTIVAELPATGDSSKLYLTPKAHTAQTATGNPITATVAEEAGKMESFKLDGDTYQQTYTGKNLYRVESRSQNGVTFTVNADGSLNIVGKATANVVIVNDVKPITLMADNSPYICWWDGADSLPTGVAIRLGIDKNGNWDHNLMSGMKGSTKSRTFTSSLGDGDAIRCELYVENGTEVNLQNIKIQLEAGSIATSYEPYVGGVPSPNPEYPQPIQTVTGEQTVEIVGKNLFDETATPWGEKVAFNDEGEQVRWTGYVGIADYQPVVSNTTYAFSNSLGKAIYYGLVFYDADKNKISFVTASTRTFTTPANCAYIRFAIQSATAPTWAQLELGSTATSYAPYHATSYPISLGSIELCKLGTYQDYIYKDGDDWKVHKATNKITVDGSENWVYPDSGANYTFFQFSRNNFRTKYGNAADFYASNTEVGFAKADKFEQIVAAAANMRTKQGIGFTTEGNGWFRISVANTIATTVNVFKTWLADHPTTVYYALAIATDTTITNTTLIAQLEAIRTASLENGTNTITNTATGSNLAGDMEIGYYGYNPRNRYDKFIWLDINNAYEQLNNPDTSSTLSTLSTRGLGATTEQPTVTRSLETETITLKKGETEPIEDKTELPTILDEEAEETETTDPEESDGTDER